MKEIKFRAVSKETGKFVYGDLIHTGYYTCIRVSRYKNSICTWEDVIVLPDTVRQYIGAKDVNGIEIYNGDTVKVSNKTNKITATIKWSDRKCKYYFDRNGGVGVKFEEIIRKCVVVNDISSNKKER